MKPFIWARKVLVHCRHGIGRTGTFVTAYLIRKGLGLKGGFAKILKASRATPSNYSQWKLVKKPINKASGELRIREPSLEIKHQVDLGRFFADYEALVSKGGPGGRNSTTSKAKPPAVTGDHPCCAQAFQGSFH
jgi:hypothetical protein